MKFILAFIAAVLVFCGYLVFDAMRARAKAKESLRARIAPDGTDYDNPAGEGVAASVTTEIGPLAQMLAGILNAIGVNMEEVTAELKPRFTQAGIASPDAPIYYVFFQRIVSLGVGMTALVLLMSGGDGSLLNRLLGLLLLGAAFLGPRLYLQNMIDKRRAVLTRSFPDTLDLLLICVESGLALDAALTRVCGELGRAYPEITAELNRTRLELALLNDRVRALMNLGERTNMVAFRSLTVALIQSERFGTSLTDTLRVMSEDFRLQRLTNAEAKAARLPVLLTIPLIFLLMPALFLIVLGPAIVKFMRDGSQVTGK